MEKLLVNNLNSLKKQSYPFFVIYLIDNNSTDVSQLFIEKL